MLVVETIAKIRRAYFAQNKPIKTICREFRVSRRVVRKVNPVAGDGLLLENEGQAGARAADADPDIRGTTRPRL
jgi:hypothetical protein